MRISDWSSDVCSSDLNPAKAMAWTRGRLLFEDVPLTTAAAEVNHYSKDVQIELADPQLEQLRVSGSYLAGDAELVVAAWEAKLPVRERNQEGRNILNRTGRVESRREQRVYMGM